MLQKKVQAQLGAPLAVTAVTHTHTHTHALTFTQSYARALSLSLSRALFAAGANGFSNRSLKSALSSSPSLSPAAAVGRDQPPILFTHLLELPLSLLAARCSLSAAQRRRRFLFAGVYVDFIAGVARFIVLICVRLLPLSLSLSVYLSLYCLLSLCLLWLSL